MKITSTPKAAATAKPEPPKPAAKAKDLKPKKNPKGGGVAMPDKTGGR